MTRARSGPRALTERALLRGDVAYHLGILAVRVLGLAISVRGGTPSPGARDG